MRMHLACGHGVVKPFLDADRVAILVVELAVRSVNMNVSACFSVLVALDGARLPLPGKLLCLLRRDSLLERFPISVVVSHRGNLLDGLNNLFRLLLRNLGDLGGVSAFMRHIAAERLGELLAVVGKDLRVLRPA